MGWSEIKKPINSYIFIRKIGLGNSYPCLNHLLPPLTGNFYVISVFSLPAVPLPTQPVWGCRLTASRDLFSVALHVLLNKKGLSSLTLKPNGINQYPATTHCTCPWISSDSLQCLYDMVIILLFFCLKYLRQNEPVPQPASVESKKVWMLHMTWDISWRNIGLFEGIWAAEIVLKDFVDWRNHGLVHTLTKKDPWKVIIVSHCSKHPTDLDNWQKLICQPYLI